MASHSPDGRSTPTKSPAKRKSSASTHDANSGLGDESGKKKRRKVNHACVYCRRSHMTCDLERPCTRCVKRDIGHLCHDEPREPPKKAKGEVGVTDAVTALENDDDGTDGNGGLQLYGQRNGVVQLDGESDAAGAGPHIVQPTPVSPTRLQRTGPEATTSNVLHNYDWNTSPNHVPNQFHDMHHLHPNYMFNTSEATNEYNLLNDFLSTSVLMDDGAMYGASGSEDAPPLMADPLLAANSFLAPPLEAPQQSDPQPAQSLQLPLQAKSGEEISRPGSAFPPSASENSSVNKFYMTAADPAGLSSAEDRLHKLLKAKYDAGMLRPFNYVRGYARLNSYMSTHLSRNSQLRILQQLDRFRPKFREAMQSLTDMQLVLVEMWFERSLMDYDRVFASMAIPACCWRRTGEIYRGNREMAQLIGVPGEKLRDGRLAIHDIIAEDSLVSYWQKFGAIAFDQSQKAMLTSCILMRVLDEKRDGDADTAPQNASGGGGGAAGWEKDKSEQKRELVKCCFSFTIRRDTHNIPSLIVGNFLPKRPRGQHISAV